MRKLIATAAIAAATLGLAACGDSAEETGENLDSSIEEATQGEENLGDGPFEQAGEGIDEATGGENNDPADAAMQAPTPNAQPNFLWNGGSRGTFTLPAALRRPTIGTQEKY